MTDQPSVTPPDPAADEPGESGGATGRAILFAFAFAAFAAWVAADFATGGALTRWAVATLAGLRGGGQDER